MRTLPTLDWYVYFWPKDHRKLNLPPRLLGRVRAPHQPAALAKAWKKFPTEPKDRIWVHRKLWLTQPL